MNKKTKVALIRGWYLNPWEMMRYEPLTDEFDISAIGTYNPLFDLSGINLSIEKLHWPGELFRVFGKTPFQLINRGLYKFFRYNQWMFGFENKLKHSDILHSADTHHMFSLQAARVKKKFGKKLVLTVWENIPFQDEKYSALKAISREVIQCTDIFMPVTERSREMLLLEGVPDEKIIVIPQPVDLNKFKPRDKDNSLLEKLGCKKNEPLILFVGRLHRTKGVDFLLYAYKRLIQDSTVSTAPRLVIVGSGEKEASLKELGRRLGVTKNICWLSSVDHGDLPAYYSAADIFVLPSIPAREWQEQFGMVIIEAMACGKPVVTTLSGSIPDVVGDAAILVQPADFTALYQALKNLISSPDMMSEYAIRARKRAESIFAPSRIAEGTAEVYRRLSGNSR